MLARREHSEQELHLKLITRGFDSEAVSLLLAQLKAEGLQSDERFTDSYVHNRIERGYGSLRIKRELRERGVADELIEAILDETEEQWLRRITDVREKKFGKSAPANYKEQARQSRFLQQRGFSGELIRQLFKSSGQ